MKRVTGIGGVFFKAKDPVAMRAWYAKHLGIDVQDWGGAVFNWTVPGSTVWCIGSMEGGSFASTPSSYLVNYRVDDLVALLEVLREEGCDVLDRTEDSEFGKFGWVIDPEGNKVELWQPPEGQ